MSVNCFSFWETSSPDSLPGLRPWSPLEDFHPQTPLGYSPLNENSCAATKTGGLIPSEFGVGDANANCPSWFCHVYKISRIRLLALHIQCRKCDAIRYLWWPNPTFSSPSLWNPPLRPLSIPSRFSLRHCFDGYVFVEIRTGRARRCNQGVFTELFCKI